MPPRAADQDARDEDIPDDDSSRGGSVQPEGDEKKSTNSTQIRKAQNRIAQREFRLRKQQYIRDLEARVEILSGDKEERIELMLLLVRNLLKENKELRGMVQSMATFVGEGMGSCLPRLGLNAAQLDAILNRADTDTAYEAFVALKASKEMEQANPGIALGTQRKRGESSAAAAAASIASANGSAAKRKRDDSMSTPPDDADKKARAESTSQAVDSSNPMNEFGQWDFLFPDSDLAAVAGTSGMSSAPVDMTAFAGMQFPRGVDSVPAVNYVPPPTGHSEGSPGDRQRSLRAAVAQMTSTRGEGTSPITATTPNSMTPAQVEGRRRMHEALRVSLESGEANERKTEALQLITYHLNNFRLNHEYSLPPSLRPTPVQRTMPHEHAIDGVLIPSVRDRMILLRGRYSLEEAFHGYVTEFTLHGDDALDHRNWEASEKWLKDFAILADDDVYAITNKWRALRGLPPVTREGDGGSAFSMGNGMGTGAGITAELMQGQR